MTHPIAAFIAGLIIRVIVGILIVSAVIRSAEID